MSGTVPALAKPERDEACRHHWVIDTPDGPTSEGRCKNCGLRRSFLNVYEDVLQAQQPVAAA